MIELPTTRSVAPKYDSVDKLVITGHQGSGKTHAVSQLPNCLVIDFEQGCKDHYEAMSINLKKICSDNDISMMQAFKKTMDSIKAANAENGGPVYDFIVFDGLTALEKLCHQAATSMFKGSVVGKGMLAKGEVVNDVVTDVAMSGWLWLFRAWEATYGSIIGHAKYCTIFLGHAKQSSLVKKGLTLEANDLALTGKLKLSLLRDVDASGMLYKEDNKCILSFKTNEKDLTTKSRARHLNNIEVVLSEMVDGKLITRWEEVFPHLKEK